LPILQKEAGISRLLFVVQIYYYPEEIFMKYRQHFSIRQTPQTQAIPDKQMVKNSAGGYVFAVDDWIRLDRFLVLGSEGGTYYANERKLTIDNAQAVVRCIKNNGPQVVAKVVEVSKGGRAPKNDPALFTLAICAGIGDIETRRAAFDVLPQVARIGTHLFHFLEYVEGFRGWGRGLRRAVANWYNYMPVDKLAYQVIKYQQRDGWSHRDALRLSHPIPDNSKDADMRNDLYKWIVGNPEAKYGDIDLIAAFEHAKVATNKLAIVSLILDEGLTREMIPTKWLNEPAIWSALLQKMPLTALIRNLGKMTRVGLLKPMGNETSLIIGKLTDQAYIKKSRLHPLAILVALKIYAQGHGMKGRLSWSPITEIINALDEAFYLSFGNTEITNKRTMLALDVSASMSWNTIAGMPITPREATGAMAMITARMEPHHIITAFSHQMIPVTLSARQRLDDVIQQIYDIPWGRTDCALPMLYALQNGIEIDTFIVYTDNETWAGNIHPVQALQQYRHQMEIPSKLVVVGMTPSGFSVADPEDSGMLDVIGFDTSTPQVISDFVKADRIE
jgi:60 kDa SS-A/Ro ribonucleoprotein